MEEAGSLDFPSLKRKKLNLSFWLISDLRAGAPWAALLRGVNEVEGGVKLG